MSHWVCSICGNDTSNVDYDYLVNYDHISCLLGVWGGKDIPTHKSKLKKPMKIKGWEKISGFTYKGFTIVNPIHNADETSYEATILNLNLPQKPKWELSVLTPAHRFKQDNHFSIILKDDENRSTINSVDKVRMASISIFRNTFEEMIDKMLAMRLTTASKVAKNSFYGGTTGIINQVQNAGTNVLYGSGSVSNPFTQSHIIQTLQTLQQQIDDYNKKLGQTY